MRTEHKRPLVAFIVVALFCSFTVGNAVRGAIVGNGFGLTILLPWAPPGLVRTITASGFNGLYPDSNPFLGTAIGAVSDVPAPPAPPTQELPKSTAPATGGVVAPAIVQPRRPTTRKPATRPHSAGYHPRPPRNIGDPPAGSAGPTTLKVAREDLRAANGYAHQARQASTQAGRDARACVRALGRSACQDVVDASDEAQIRADSAATEVGHLRSVVDHLVTEINTLVAPVRAKATSTYRVRVGRAQQQLVLKRAEVRSASQAFNEDRRNEWSEATKAYVTAVETARVAMHKASEQRLRQVQSYAKSREKAVRHINEIYEEKVRRGHPVEARAYRKRAMANLASRDHEFNAKIAAERDQARASYETALGGARDELDRTRVEAAAAKEKQAAQAAAVVARAADRFQAKVATEAEVRAQTIAEAQAEAEATVVVDPATIPVDPLPGGETPPAGPTSAP